MPRQRSYPLDLRATPYSYLERPNRALLGLFDRYVLSGLPSARVLDVGCGTGVNAKVIRSGGQQVTVVGIEPNPVAHGMASKICNEAFLGTSEEWLRENALREFDAVLLSDVLEHIADPVGFLRGLAAAPGLRRASFIVSVPNYAVWYNRLATLSGRFRYEWSGLYDRTHLRFFTRNSVHELLRYCGFGVLAVSCTPSLVQSAAPWLRRLFERDLDEGQHQALVGSPLFAAYETWVEPFEQSLCSLAPELLGFQIVTIARLTEEN